MRVGRQLLAIAAVGWIGYGRIEAQSAQRFAVQGSVLYNGISGPAFEGLDDGKGFEAQVRYTPGALSFGLGFQYTSHGIGNPVFPDLHVRLFGPFFEPRYRIRIASEVVAPYISGRFSIMTVNYSEEAFSVTSRFLQMNAGGGLLVRVAPRVNLDIGATYGYDRLGSGTLKVTIGETTADNAVPKSSGGNIVIRVGLAIGIAG